MPGLSIVLPSEGVPEPLNPTIMGFGPPFQVG